VRRVGLRGPGGFHPAIALASLFACALAGSSAGRAKTPALPHYSAPARELWLDQGWSDQQRSWYHHVSQGTDTLPIPYAWFLALERPEPSLASPGLLSDPAYLDRLGFIPSPRGADNPDGLPVGFARTTAIDPNDGKPFDHVGFTCAACHTGRIDYRGTRLLIDGGPALIDVVRFQKIVALALGFTDISPSRMARFADRVLGPRHSLADLTRLKLAVKQVVLRGIAMELSSPGEKASVEEGFGRLDALNRIGNEVFADQMKRRANHAPLTAPVAYPHIWGSAWYDWVQYNSSIEQPMVRNAGEAMGVRALVNYGTSPDAPTPIFTSTVPLDRLHAIEELLAGKQQPTVANRFTGLQAPTWPAIFPAIDPVLAAEGAALYERHCSGCHLPAPSSAAFWTSPAWLPANADGMRFLRPTVVRVDSIGTDEAQAVDMKRRVVRAPLAFGLSGRLSSAGADGIYAYGPALGQVVERVANRWYDSRTPPTAPADRNRMNGDRPNGIRDGIGGANGTDPVYKSRPLDGIWATAPYLHNGAVPTLYDLLSPYDERPKSFWLGNREFDQVKVGYATGPIAGGFRLVAVDPKTGRMVRGNGNGGHLFETPKAGQSASAKPRPGIIGPGLSPHERAALVEYLKTL
jgi:hypothetical protein